MDIIWLHVFILGYKVPLSLYVSVYIPTQKSSCMFHNNTLAQFVRVCITPITPNCIKKNTEEQPDRTTLCL